MHFPWIHRRWVQPAFWQSAPVTQEQGQPVLVQTPPWHLVRGQQLATLKQSISWEQEAGHWTPVRESHLPLRQNCSSAQAVT